MDGINIERFARGLTENLEPHVRKHLKNVYATFTLSCLMACLGGYVDLFSSIISAGIMTSLGGLALMIMLMMNQDNGKNHKERLAMLCGFAFLAGVNMGPLLQMAILVDPTLILHALLGTSIVFACFSLAALYAPRGQYLYLGGMLMSGLSIVFWLSLANIFFGSRLLFQANLYIGLAVMCGFVVFDTQHIIEKVRGGNKDYILHSLELFIDFIAIFKRILVLLTDKEAQSKRKKRSN